VTLKFDRFVRDTGARRLLSGGREIHLSPKAFDLLVLLVSKRPNAVSKATIQNALWTSTPVEANVANLAGEVRRALEDNRMAPWFIRMVPRFGKLSTWTFCPSRASCRHCDRHLTSTDPIVLRRWPVGRRQVQASVSPLPVCGDR
jgi:hypothetical protein